jgi:hypothetical protein
MKTSRFSISTLSVALALSGFSGSTLPAQTNQTAANKDAQLLKIPSPLEEITQLSKSGVGDAVVLTYIQNSTQRYTLNAQDIISLRDQGVSAEVTTALIRRGAEVRQAVEESYRQQQQQLQAEAATVAAAPTYQTPPAPTVVVPAPVTYYVPAPRSTVSVHYFGTPRYHYQPVYQSGYRYYGSGYSYAPQVSFGVGFGGGSRHYGGYRSSARYCP